METIHSQIEAYLDFCKYNRNMTRQTLSSKRAVLNQFARQVAIEDMREFTNEVFKSWQKSLLCSGTVAARTVNTRVNHVISLCRWLKEEGYSVPINLNRVYRLEEDPPRRKFFTRKEIVRAKNYADELSWLLISLAFDSGLRISELRNLRLSNVSDREMNIIGKGRKAGRLFMSQETRDKLDCWIDSQKINDYLWPSPKYNDGRPYSVDELRYRMKRAFDKAGLDGFYPHALRHSFGTELQINGAPIDVAQRLMRHSSMATTEKYLHGLDDCRLVEMYDKFKTPTGV